MTASGSPSEFSLCQSSRAEWPSVRIAWTASWSQLDAGNCKTIKFMPFTIYAAGARTLVRLQVISAYNIRAAKRHKCRAPSAVARQCKSEIRSFNLQFVILDHRVAQEFVGGVIELLAGGFLVCAVEVDFEVFADVHGFDA